jgi:hypothetical protein
MADFEFSITETTEMVDLEEYFNYLIMERCNEIYYKIISHENIKICKRRSRNVLRNY